MGVDETGQGGPANRTRQTDCLLRAFPNEDVCFWTKSIDNSGVVPEDDPKSTGTRWRLFWSFWLAVMTVSILLLPHAHNIFVGYEITNLESQVRDLSNDITALDVEIERALNSGQMDQAAQRQDYSAPMVGSIFYLQPAGDSALAMNASSR